MPPAKASALRGAAWAAAAVVSGLLAGLESRDPPATDLPATLPPTDCRGQRPDKPSTARQQPFNPAARGRTPR
ncbi:hypothetical protein GCM10007170_14510 [Arthrobacter liuii]|uniref:Uncharacterized protein n=1 Tax=Arthrobacter liuii TaxID=1476996 RepID=A0ABQ2APS0_9MICC|nr:hypothetical protein GCM10007170_14510 [Arthrobacter liuii]